MIKIKVLDKELTIEEARDLYNELHKLFNTPFGKFNRDSFNPHPSIFTPLKSDTFSHNPPPGNE